MHRRRYMHVTVPGQPIATVGCGCCRRRALGSRSCSVHNTDRDPNPNPHYSPLAAAAGRRGFASPAGVKYGRDFQTTWLGDKGCVRA